MVSVQSDIRVIVLIPNSQRLIMTIMFNFTLDNAIFDISGYLRVFRIYISFYIF